MKTFIIAAVATAFALPAFAATVSTNHLESPAEIAAQGGSFGPSNVDLSTLYAGIDSPAEMNAFAKIASGDFVSTKGQRELTDAHKTLSLESAAEIAAALR